MPDKRIALTGEVTIGNKSYTLISEAGRGAASICYKAECEGIKYVIKEFYPLGIAERDIRGTVIAKLHKQEEFDKKKIAFIESARFHKEELPKFQQNNFISVTEYDESGFIVMPDTSGKPLYDWAKEQTINDSYIKECIEVMNCILDELDKYHKNGYVHLDLKAENIYKFNETNVLTRIFDFDSIQSIDSLYDDIKNNRAHIHTTNECYGPEIDDINFRNAEYITKDMLVRLDYYALARVFHYLLYGKYRKSVLDDDTQFENSYGGFTVLNGYLHNMFNELFADITERTVDIEMMKGYFDRIAFILNNRDRWDEFSSENIAIKFKMKLMSDIEIDERCYTVQKGLTAIEQVEKEYDTSLFIHGYDGGRGKTTAMKWLMFRRMTMPGKLYLHIPLNELGNSDIEKQILDRYRIENIPQDSVLLLDGYNEIENTRTKEKFDEYFRKVSEENRVIICGRYNDKMFNDMHYCRLIGLPENRRLDMPYLSKELATNPMVADLYEKIDMNNIPEDAREHMIGKETPRGIEISTPGEALYNYFQIQIYEKSKEDVRAAEEYEEFIFELLPELRSCYDGNYYRRIEKDSIEFECESYRRCFERCNKLFCLVKEVKDGRKIYYEFVHQDYFDFFEAIGIVRELHRIAKDCDIENSEIPFVTNMAKDILGVHYCEPKVGDENIIVPKGYRKSYFGNGKSVCESDDNIRYFGGTNILLLLLEQMRNDFEIDDEKVRTVIDALPSEYMDYSKLNIGWMLPVDEDFYCGDVYDDCADVVDPNFRRTFSNIRFDYSYIRLPEMCDKYIENCRFKHMTSNSFVPYRLKPWSKKEIVKIGNCIYTSGKETLLDYVGPKSGADEIVLFEETERIDEEFRKNCMNPDAKIVNESPYFELRDGIVYNLYYSYEDTDDEKEAYSIEFCERNIETIKDFDNVQIIRSYACANCKKLVSVNEDGYDDRYEDGYEDGDEYEDNDYIMSIGNSAFVECSSLEIITVPASRKLGTHILHNCSSIKECKFYVFEDLYPFIEDNETIPENIHLIEVYCGRTGGGSTKVITGRRGRIDGGSSTEITGGRGRVKGGSTHWEPTHWEPSYNTHIVDKYCFRGRMMHVWLKNCY